MKHNHLAGFAIAAAILGVLAFAAWSLFEVRPAARPIPPSREARVNEYLAFDRWLEGMGYTVRIEHSGGLALVSRAQERRIFIQSSLFRWTDEAAGYLINWVAEGGALFVALDESRSEYDDEPWRMLEAMGISAATGRPDYYYDPESPAYDMRVSFEADAAALLLNDRNGVARIARVSYGKGTLTASGRPRFLLSSRLDADSQGTAPNARLAAALELCRGAVDISAAPAAPRPLVLEALR